MESVLCLTEPPRIVGNYESEISKVAICTGSSGDAIDAAIHNDCDLIVTGDVRHHQAQKAREMRLNIIDAGHYGTEYIFIRNFAGKLRKAIQNRAEILESKVIVNPFDSVL